MTLCCLRFAIRIFPFASVGKEWAEVDQENFFFFASLRYAMNGRE
jgi:hypothetical protein